MDYLATSQVIVDSGLLILIWLVQIIIYPSFRYTSEEYFIPWHTRYTKLITLVVGPLMLAQAGVELFNIFYQEPQWHRILIIAAIWISTFTISVPCHDRLKIEGKQSDIIEKLIKTNWIRTTLWSFLFLETTYHAYLYVL